MLRTVHRIDTRGYRVDVARSGGHLGLPRSRPVRRRLWRRRRRRRKRLSPDTRTPRQIRPDRKRGGRLKPEVVGRKAVASGRRKWDVRLRRVFLHPASRSVKIRRQLRVQLRSGRENRRQEELGWDSVAPFLVLIWAIKFSMFVVTTRGRGILSWAAALTVSAEFLIFRGILRNLMLPGDWWYHRPRDQWRN